MTDADLDNWFTYHTPFGNQAERYAKIREAAKAYARVVIENTPPCPDQTVAVRKIRETVMAANLTIACNEKAP